MQALSGGPLGGDVRARSTRRSLRWCETRQTRPSRFFLEKQKANLQYWRKHHTPTVVSRVLADLASAPPAAGIVGYSATSLVAPTNSVPRQKVRRSAACVRWLIGLQ